MHWVSVSRLGGLDHSIIILFFYIRMQSTQSKQGHAPRRSRLAHAHALLIDACFPPRLWRRPTADEDFARFAGPHCRAGQSTHTVGAALSAPKTWQPLQPLQYCRLLEQVQETTSRRARWDPQSPCACVRADGTNASQGGRAPSVGCCACVRKVKTSREWSLSGCVGGSRGGVAAAAGRFGCAGFVYDVMGVRHRGPRVAAAL